MQKDHQITTIVWSQGFVNRVFSIFGSLIPKVSHF